jgi:hypothetical protein
MTDDVSTNDFGEITMRVFRAIGAHTDDQKNQDDWFRLMIGVSSALLALLARATQMMPDEIDVMLDTACESIRTCTWGIIRAADSSIGDVLDPKEPGS